MYEKLPNLVIGFHGCSKETYEAVIAKHEELKASNNTYDWLGNGIYFWENNLARAKEWAERRYGEEASVLGAVLDLGLCLNLTDSSSERILKKGYSILSTLYSDLGAELPKNRDSLKTKDILLRDLDCAVIQAVQKTYTLEDGSTGFDSVRGVFTEGEAVFPGSAILAKTHKQQFFEWCSA